MTINKKLELFKEELEKEFSNDAIRVCILYDDENKLLSVGIEHPLWHSFLCDMRFLPKRKLEATLTELYEQFKHDMGVINEQIRRKYELED